MLHSDHSHPGGAVGGPEMGQPGNSGSPFPGPTPSPHPPSPMMPGPSMQCGEAGGPPGAAAGGAGQTQAGSHAGCCGQAEYGAATHHPGADSSRYEHAGSPQAAYMHHPPLHEACHYGYYPHGIAPQYPVPSSAGYSVFGLNFSDANFWKGALIGAAVTLLVTNERVQKAIMKGAMKAYSSAQDSVGELKEKFEDIQAELKKPKQ